METKDFVERVCQFYAVGSDEKNFLAYDEYDSKGNGDYYAGDLLMISRFNCGEADEKAKAKGKKVWLVTLGKYSSGEVKAEIALFSEG